MQKPWKARIALLSILIALGTICWSLALVSLATTQEPVWRLITHIKTQLHQVGLAGQEYCWLCGMSRAFRALWQGDLNTANRLNPNSVWLFELMLSGCAISSVGSWISWRRR